MKTLPSCFAIRPGGCSHMPPDGPERSRAERAAYAGRLRCSLTAWHTGSLQRDSRGVRGGVGKE